MTRSEGTTMPATPHSISFADLRNHATYDCDDGTVMDLLHFSLLHPEDPNLREHAAELFLRGRSYCEFLSWVRLQRDGHA